MVYRRFIRGKVVILEVKIMIKVEKLTAGTIKEGIIASAKHYFKDPK